MFPLSVLVVDQLASVRETIRTLVLGHRGWVYVEAEEQNDILASVASSHAKLLVMDVSAPIMNAIHSIRQIAEQHPEVRILATSVYVTCDLAEQVRDAGGHGIIEKVDLRRELDNAVRAFREGQTFFLMLTE